MTDLRRDGGKHSHMFDSLTFIKSCYLVSLINAGPFLYSHSINDGKFIYICLNKKIYFVIN
jgi:hypothetical protein